MQTKNQIPQTVEVDGWNARSYVCIYTQSDQVPSLDSTAYVSIYISLVFTILKSLKIVKFKRLSKEKNVQNDRHSTKTTILVQISDKKRIFKTIKKCNGFLKQKIRRKFQFFTTINFHAKTSFNDLRRILLLLCRPFSVQLPPLTDYFFHF